MKVTSLFCEPPYTEAVSSSSQALETEESQADNVVDLDRARRPSAPPPPTRATREFAQERARATHEALIRASSEVFARLGFDAAQTSDIAKAAGVSVGTFYRYFGDKRQAFIEMTAIHLERIHLAVTADMTTDAFGESHTDAERRATIDQLLEVLFRHISEQPELHRVFHAMSLRDTDVAKLREDYERRARELLANLIRLIVPRERVPDPAAAARVVQIATQEVAFAALSPNSTMPDTVLAQRRALGDMLHRYLFSR